MANEIFTRIQLKYDSYAEWDKVKDTFKPLKGEVCIVNPGTKLNNADAVPCLIKVGDGDHFWKDLPWLSALAADVYAWAKKATPDWADFPALPITVVDNETGKFVTDVEYSNNTVTIHRANVQWGDVENKPDLVNTVKTTGDDIVVLTPETAASGDVVIHGEHAKKGPANGYTGTQAEKSINAFGQSIEIVVPKLTVDNYGHTNGAEDVKYTIALPTPEAAVNTVTTVVGKEAIVVEDKATNGNHDYEVTLKLDETGHNLSHHVHLEQGLNGLKATYDLDNGLEDIGITHNDNGSVSVSHSFDAQNVYKNVNGTFKELATEEAVTAALAEAKKYADDNDTNTAHTHSNGKGTLATGGGIDGDVKVNLNLKFEELTADNKLRLVDATSSELVAEFDAAAFVEDSYLKSVTYSDTDGDNKLTFVFELNNGDTTTVDVDLSHLVDVYVADETTITLVTSGDGKVFKIKDGGVGTTQLADAAVTEGKIGANAVTEGKIGAGAVTEAKIAANAVATGKIADKAVTKAKLEESVQTSLGKADSAIQKVSIEEGGSDFVSGVLGVSCSTDSNKEVNAFIGVKKGGIVTNALADKAVTTEKINDGAVTYDKLAKEVKDKFDGIDGDLDNLGDLAWKDNITHELVTDFDEAVKAVKVDDAVHAGVADLASLAATANIAKKLDTTVEGGTGIVIDQDITFSGMAGGINTIWKHNEIVVQNGSVSDDTAKIRVTRYEYNGAEHTTTIEGGSISAEDITVDKATIGGVEITSKTTATGATKYLVFNCGSASVLVD